jgi:hypothetical protein
LNKLTLVLFVVAVIMGGVAYYEYENSKEEKVEQAREAQIIGWGQEELTSATLKKGKKHLHVEKRDGNWWIVEPLEDFGDQFNMKSWTGDIATEKGKRIEAKKTASGEVFWAEYGLDKDLTEITIEKKDGEKAVIFFAKNSTFDGQFFARYKDEVYVAVRPWTGVMAKTADNLRSRDVFRKKQKISKVRLQVGSDDYTLLAEEDELRRLEGDESFQFDSTAATAFGRQLSGLRIQTFVDDPDELKNPDHFGLKKPLGILTVTMGDSDYELKIGKKKSKAEDEEDKYYCKASDAKGFYELNAAAAKSLLKNKQDFMNKRIPFRFDLTEAKTLEFSTSGQTLKVEKETSDWRLSEEAGGRSLKVSELESFLAELSGLAAREYSEKPKRLKFDNKVVIRSKDGSEIFNFAWTKKDPDDSMFTGVSNLVDVGFTVSASKLKNWTIDQFLEDSSEVEEEAPAAQVEK